MEIRNTELTETMEEKPWNFCYFGSFWPMMFTSAYMSTCIINILELGLGVISREGRS